MNCGKILTAWYYLMSRHLEHPPRTRPRSSAEERRTAVAQEEEEVVEAPPAVLAYACGQLVLLFIIILHFR